MKKITTILFLATFFMANTAFACINGVTLALKNGMQVYDDHHEMIPYGHSFINNTKALNKNIREMERLYTKTKNLYLCN